MRKLLLTALVLTAGLRADFTYQETTQMTGGSVLAMMKALGPLARHSREPTTSTHMIQGNRMVDFTKDHASIIDLDKESITEVDLNKKTYSVMTFAEMKQAMEDAMQRAQGKGTTDSKIEAQFKVSAKPTGQIKTIQGLSAKELIITMVIEGKDQQSGQTGALTTTMDTWVASVPGYDEVKKFYRKMGEKMGYGFGSGMSQIGMMRPETMKGLTEAGKELTKLDGTPVQTIIKMGGPADGQTEASPQTQSQPQEKQRSESPLSLGRLAVGLGGFGRKKNDQPQQQPAQGPEQSGSLMEMTTELTGFSSNPVDSSKFEVPAGFKQVQGDGRRRSR